MNKKINTVLFILGATLFNIIVTILFIGILAIVSIRFIVPHLPESISSNSQIWALVLSFIGGIALSFILYRYALGFLMKKISVDKYFDPIIGKRRPK